MNKKITTELQDLLNHTYKINKSIHSQTFIAKNERFSLDLVDFKKTSYKAYARFPIVELPIKHIVSRLFKLISDFIKRERYKRPFEIYFYGGNYDLLKGFFHYYLKAEQFEKLPDIQSFDQKKILIKKPPHKVKAMLIITVLLTSLPNNNKNWWYRNCLMEAGRLIEIIESFARTNGMNTQTTHFDDLELNKFININPVKEAAVGCITIY